VAIHGGPGTIILVMKNLAAAAEPLPCYDIQDRHKYISQEVYV